MLNKGVGGGGQFSVGRHAKSDLVGLVRKQGL